MNDPRPIEPGLRRAWRGALACFVVAGLTGAGFRLGMLLGFGGGLEPANVRHAHSHLMLLGWVTPALMALITARASVLTGRASPGFLRRAIGWTIGLALLAYTPFLLFGYAPAPLGASRVPLGAISAGLNIFAWYAFAVGYARLTRGVPRILPFWMWDAALGMAVLASLGAWGLGALRAAGVTDPFWPAASLHLFLNLFSEGWVELALLGWLFARFPAAVGRAGRAGAVLLAVGLPLSFLLGVPILLVPPGLRSLAGAAGLVAAAGLLLCLGALWPAVRGGAERAWRVPLACLALKAAAQVGVSITPLAVWAEGMGLRVIYLHLLLLGFATLGLVAAARDEWGPEVTRGARGLTAAVLLLLLSLVPLTGLWPAPLAGRWPWVAAAGVALLPVAAVVYMLGRGGGVEQAGR